MKIEQEEERNSQEYQLMWWTISEKRIWSKMNSKNFSNATENVLTEEKRRIYYRNLELEQLDQSPKRNHLLQSLVAEANHLPVSTASPSPSPSPTPEARVKATAGRDASPAVPVSMAV